MQQSVLQTTNVLKVTNVSEVKPSSTGNGTYQTITVQQFRILAVGNKTIEMATANVSTRNLWSERKTKDGKSTVKGDVLFGQVVKDGYISGEILHFNTTPYEIDGKTVTSYKVLKFEGENAVNVANSALSSKLACVVDENGVPTRDLKTLSVTKVEETV